MTQSTLKNQQGAALAIGLILLLIITLMGYTGMKGTMLQEKMAAGLHNRSLAAGGANSALRNGERFLFNLVENTNGVIAEGTSNGALFNIYSYYATPGDPDSGINPVIEGFIKNDFSSTAGTEHSYNFVGVSKAAAALKDNPEYIIYNVKSPTSAGGGSTLSNTQEFGSGSSGSGGGSFSDQQSSYIVTGKSTSGDGNSIAIVQSLFTVVGSSNPSQ